MFGRRVTQSSQLINRRKAIVPNTLNRSFGGSALGQRSFKRFIITETAYTPLQDLSVHSHQQAFIAIALQGAYRESVDSSTYECLAGQTIFHAPGEAHSNSFDETGAHILNLEILGPFSKQLGELGLELRDRTQLDDPYVCQLGLRLYEEYRQNDAASGLAIEGLALELIAAVHRKRKSEKASRHVDWLKAVHDQIHERYRDDLSVCELAAHAGVHPVYLARAFRSRFRCTVGAYVRCLRVARACQELVSSDATIAEIAGRNGFSDQSHLNRLVKHYTGMSPGRIRRHKTRVSLP